MGRFSTSSSPSSSSSSSPSVPRARAAAAAAFPPNKTKPAAPSSAAVQAAGRRAVAICPRPFARGLPPRPAKTLSQTTAASPRSPLRVQDRNRLHHGAAPLTSSSLSSSSSSSSSTSSAVKMPLDDRARRPQLTATAAAAAAAARGPQRGPLTPKIAVKPAPPKRPQAVPSPVSAQATPRSVARPPRVDSPGASSPAQLLPGAHHDAASPLDAPTASAASPRPGPDSPADQQADGNKFFYASDARPVPRPTSVPQRPMSVPQRPVTFFYANGASADARRTTSPPLNQTFTPVLPPTREPVATKFFYANGTPDLAPKHALATPSTLSASSRQPSARPGTSGSATQRPLSPIKTTTCAPTSQPGSANPPSSVSPKQPHSSQSSPALPHSSARSRVSVDAAPRLVRPAHSRTGSTSAVDAPVASRFAASTASSQTASPPLSPAVSQPAMTMASLIQAADELRDRDVDRDAEAQPDLSQSPAKSSLAVDPVSELVANARRERKVQDLEITNASLEAINRTLERQLRKQTMELRRYRRMSRAGHISLVSAASSRVSSAALPDDAAELPSVDEEDETADDDDDDDDDQDADEYPDSLDESDFSGSEPPSDPSSPNDKLVARRKRDERRLQLDLTKHQELLVDSQKMNQSIKRCLDWTEVLIKEGQKALAYHVRVSDVELGGRVLAPLDDDDDDDDDLETPRLGPPRPKTSQDRDSGVELPGDGG